MTTAKIVIGRIYLSKLRLVETAQIELSSFLTGCTSEPKTVNQYWPKYSNQPNRQLRLVTPLFLTATIT